MKKKVIGIDINEILRARWLQFDKLYVEEFGEEGVPKEEYVYDFWKHYEWKDTEEEIKFLKDEDEMPDINAKHYKQNEEGNYDVDAFIMKKEIVKHSAKENYNKFMYEDYCFEIFGSAPKMYKRVDYDLDLFYKKFMKQFEFVIVSKENWFSIPPTLFFLSSQITSRIRKYYFAETNEDIWENVDYLITTDPELLSAPEGKEVIKLNRPFNEEIKTKYSAINFIDLIKNEEFIKLIDFNQEIDGDENNDKNN